MATIRFLCTIALAHITQISAQPFGIQYGNITLSKLADHGCSVCFDETYSTPTTSARIEACAGSYLFVGARLTTDDKFELGAFAAAEDIKTKTALNTPHLANGVYWYFTPGVSFGFLNSTILLQNQADIATSDGKSRLSWHLDMNIGGERVGNHLELNQGAAYHKSIYSCNYNGSIPTLNHPPSTPTLSITAMPSVSSTRESPTPAALSSAAPTIEKPVEKSRTAEEVENGPPSGVQYSAVNVAGLEAHGCYICYDDLYASPTNTSMIDSCNGEYLFVAARLGFETFFELGAFALASDIKTQTALNTPHLANGVYWYFTPGYSFGFLNGTDLLQNQADVSTSNGAARLSWHLDLNMGGNRVGNQISMDYNTRYYKSIFSCPSSDSLASRR
jgi:hypothetical protein